MGWVKSFLGYQSILDPKNTHTLERGKNQRNQGILWRWKKEVCIIINIMVVAQNNMLKSKGYLNIIYFKEKVNM
jgi:hypothetical protein